MADNSSLPIKGESESTDAEELPLNPTYFERWVSRDSKNVYNQPLKSEDDFDGPVSNRKCTELFWLLLYIPMIAGLASLCYMTIERGDIQRILHNYDFRGELCGVDDLSGREYAYWPDPASELDFVMCVPGCPINEVSDGICLYDIDHETEVLPCFKTYQSRPFNHQCLPADSDLREYITDMIFEDEDEITRRAAGDIFRTWDVISISIGVSLAVSLVYLIFFRFPSTLPAVIVASATLTVLLFGFIAYFLFSETDRIYDNIHDDFHGVDMDGDDKTIHTRIYQYLSYISIIMGILVAIIFVVLIPKLRRTVGILRISTRPLKNIPALLFLPILQVILGGCVFVLMISTSMWAISIGDIDTESYKEVPGGEIKIIDYYTSYRYSLLFIIPMCLWLLSLIITMGEFIATSAASYWFFSKEKTVLQSPIAKSVENMLKYHMGSLIIASILVPMFRSTKAIFGWCKGMFRKNRTSCARGSSNFLCCCFELHQRLLRFMHSDLLTFIAIWGDEFNPAGKKAYFLKARSRQNIKTLATAGGFVTWMCSSVICLAAPTACLYWIVYEPETFAGVDCDLITSAIGPALVAFAGAYYISEVFTGVFRGCMNSAIICFVADVELFIDNERFANKEYNVYLSKQKKVVPIDEDMGSYHSGEFKTEMDARGTAVTETLSTARGEQSLAPTSKVQVLTNITEQNQEYLEHSSLLEEPQVNEGDDEKDPKGKAAHSKIVSGNTNDQQSLSSDSDIEELERSLNG